MKPAYQTDRAGLYTGITEADESPLEPGVYLLPLGATFVAPPATWPANKWPRFNGHAWELVVKPKLSQDINPIEKLRAFLAENPDVAALMQPADGGANV